MKQYIRGMQHIGIPTKHFEGTLDFYHSLGFETIMRTKNGGTDVAFLKLCDVTIEVYEGGEANKTGAINHIALDVTDVDAAYEAARKKSYKIADDEVNYLPFWKNGVRYFTITGLNGERIEFNQKL